ncbi:hypothetical protein SNE40_001772 [Patella caerulea]|uniref:Uncharacterized protein n=1 Tax=Patella caerulea TaxID=87958 RepID=A0AAN8K794_PATCE
MEESVFNQREESEKNLKMSMESASNRIYNCDVEVICLQVFRCFPQRYLEARQLSLSDATSQEESTCPRLQTLPQSLQAQNLQVG